MTLVLSQAAVDYAKRGLRVLPLQPRGKIPVIEQWQDAATADPARVEATWEKMRTSNIGVAMGPGSGIVDFEADDQSAEQALAELFDGEFPTCPTFKSSRGVHRVFRYSDRLPKKATHKIGKLDIKIGANGRGSQCVFPPSIHPSGVRYEWLPGLSLDDVDPPEIPSRVLDKLQETPPTEKSSPQSEVLIWRDRGRIIERARKYLAKMDPAVSGQGGHDRAFHAACVLVLGFNLSVDEALPVISEWNATCQPPWSEKELLHKLNDADKRTEPRGQLLETDRPDKAVDVDGAQLAPSAPVIERQRGRLKVISSAELAATNIRLQYLAEPVLVAGQPCVLAGGKKTLKTNISIDLVLSLSSAGLFLGKFRVPEAVRVALLSGESGQATIAETARRIANSKGWSLEHFENAHWGFNLPRLGEPGCREALDEFIRENELGVVIIDPTYLALPLGDTAGNLFQVGEKLVEINEVFETNGCTPILSHHTRKNSISPFEPPELEDIAWAGFQEWARQWMLLGRRRRYDPEQGGHHELWLNIGGSAGHSSLWALNINEGTREDVGGRRWDLAIVKPSEARAAAAGDEHEKRRTVAEQKQMAIAQADREKVLKAFRAAPDGESKSQFRDMAGIPTGRFGSTLAALIEDKTVEACKVTKANGQTYDGYRLTREHSGRVGIPGLTE